MVDLTTESFHGWTSTPGSTPSRPTLTASETANNLHLTVRGMNDRIYLNTWNTLSWEEWTIVPHGSTCDSPAISRIGNSVVIAVRGMDGCSIWCNLMSDNIFSDWVKIPGSTPSASTLDREHE